MVPMMFIIGGVALTFVGLGIIRARRGQAVNAPMLILGFIVGAFFMIVSVIAIVTTDYPGS